MNNDLNALNNILFEQIERINDDSIKGEELKEAIRKAEIINNLASTVVKNADTQLKAFEMIGGKNTSIPKALGING